MKRDDQSGSILWMGIARQALLPGEPPMRRVQIFSVGARGGESKAELSRQIVWLRTTFSQVSWMPQSGQSRQSTEAEARGELASAVGGDESTREEECGKTTALTRRGLSEVLLS